MEKKDKKLPIIIGAVAVAVIAVIVVVVIMNKGHRVIKVESFQGSVTLERGSSEKDIVDGMNLKSEDTVTTGSDGLVELLVDEDKHIVAEANTCFTITSSGNDKRGKLKIKLEYGTSLVEIDNKLPEGSSVELETPNAALSVRGTTFETTYAGDDNTTVVKVTDGVVSVATDKEAAEVEAGNMAIVKGDEIAVTILPIEYRDVVAFEARYFSDNNFSGIFVKELIGWTYISSAQNKNGPDIFENKGVKIRYWVYTEDEMNADIDNSDEAGHLKNMEKLKNDDGDLIICASYEFNGDAGDIAYAYQYFKEVQDNMYLSIMVYDEDGGQSLGDVTIETYLPLTNDCYYVYGTDLGADESNEGTEEVVTEDALAGDFIAENEWPNLLKSGSTSLQLEYMLKIAQIGKYEGNNNYLQIALKDLCNTQTSAIEELYKTPENNNVYAIDKLNNMFSFLTDDKIGEEHLTPPSTINGNELTCIYSEPLSGEHIVDAIIVKAYYNDSNEIIVEFRYTIFNYDTTEIKYADSVAHLVQDETGKYVFGYIE